MSDLSGTGADDDRKPPGSMPAPSVTPLPRGSLLLRQRVAPGLPSRDATSSRDIFVCILVALAELCLVLIGLAGALSLTVVLLAHCAIMLGVTLVLDQREQHRQDSRVLAIAVVTTAIAGPIGAALSAVLGLYLRYQRVETELLQNWYDRISGQTDADPVNDRYESIQSGRSLNPFVDSRTRFAAILRLGPLEEKQRVLSVITQKYHPSFAPLLQLALRNDDPPIRVQAAAVAARLRESQRVRARTLMVEATEVLHGAPERRFEVVGHLQACLASGLLDEQDAATCRALVQALCASVLEGEPDNARAAVLLAEQHLTADEVTAAAALLEPLAARQVEAAYGPLRRCRLRQRRFFEAALLADQMGRATGEVT